MSDAIADFIQRWKPSGGSEVANFPSFAGELTRLLGVEPPKPATSDGQNNDYRFERPVSFTHTGKLGRGRIDLYRKGCFILEAKQGANPDPTPTPQLSLPGDDAITQKGHARRGTAKWDDTMLRARNQADGYARAVAKEDGWPPFLLVVDVGHVIEVYAISRARASPAEPVLRDFKNIENRDAVLDWDTRRERRDANGALVTRWDGIGTLVHNVTGKRVPDPQARTRAEGGRFLGP